MYTERANAELRRENLNTNVRMINIELLHLVYIRKEIWEEGEGKRKGESERKRKK